MNIEATLGKEHAKKLLSIQKQTGQTVGEVLNQAIDIYYQEVQLHRQTSDQTSSPGEFSKDSLIGLFAGSPDLAALSEEILQQEISTASGFTWKKP